MTTVLGVIGYFGLTGELFTKFDRATGGFQDPNVFGPFLIFPFVVLVRRGADPAARRARSSAARSRSSIFVGIFLSFSRAAWGLTVARRAADGRAALRHRAERQGARPLRRRSAPSGVVPIAVLLAAALSIPAVSDLFEERAQIVQDYDAGHLGRFQRHAIGFNMMLDHPLGIGAIEFGTHLRRGRARHLAEDADHLRLARLRRLPDAGASGR